jgi:deazaflavin-dependent oxidoreductase (nitroreductase family)
MRSFNKHILNKFTRLFAHLPRGPFAVIRHTGRRTGKVYETPIMVEPTRDSFVVALTYGSDVDWYRNVLSTGHAELLWHGKEYSLEKPEPLAAQTALPLFSPFQRRILRSRGTHDFVSMKRRRQVGAAEPARV